MQTFLIILAVVYVIGGCCAVKVEEDLYTTHSLGRMARRFIAWPTDPMWAVAILFPSRFR